MKSTIHIHLEGYQLLETGKPGEADSQTQILFLIALL